jgi:tetratricopeptide (TPR) repeat protein
MDKFKIALTILFILIISSWTIAQDSIDYAKIIKETVGFSCVKYDTASVNLTLKNLLAIDTLKISKGLFEYRNDLGMAYYMKAALYKQNKWFYLAISNYQKCISIDRTNGSPYYSIALIYHFLGDIKNAKIFLELYKKYTPETQWDNKFIDKIEKEKDK